MIDSIVSNVKMKIYKMNITLDISVPSPDKEGMTPQTCRAARSLLGLSQAELGERAGVTMLTVRNYESEKTEPSYKTWRAIRTALEKGGIIFLDEDDNLGPGVRLKKVRGAK